LLYESPSPHRQNWPPRKLKNPIFLLVGSASCFHIPAGKAKNNHRNLLVKIVSINLAEIVLRKKPEGFLPQRFSSPAYRLMPHTCVLVIKVENSNEPTKLSSFPIKANATKRPKRKPINTGKK